jgi:hypothetical protein
MHQSPRDCVDLAGVPSAMTALLHTVTECASAIITRILC